MLEKKIETKRPDIQKIYTTQEIAEYLDTSETIVRNIASYYHIQRSVAPTGNSRAAFYTYDAVREIKAHFEAKKNKESQAKIRQKLLEKELMDEEISTLHPLVKDKRFLKLSYFPDVIPDCFKEIKEK